MKNRLGLWATALLVVLLLAAPPAGARDDGEASESAALDRVLAALAQRPPETVRDYRIAFRELSLVGDSALPHLKSLLKRYVDGPGFDDAAAHAFLGDRHFDHPIPEDIAFRGHPFLRTVEEANAREWFSAEDEADWILARAALRAMELHHRRLVEDHRYRAGDQVFANVALDPRFAGRELAFTWADPYAVVEVGPPTAADDLVTTIELLRRTYRTFLDEYGERFGLSDLMAPWGGRPDERPHVRSFPDGAPLTVFLYGDRETFQVVALRASDYGLPHAARDIEVWFSPAGALHASGSARLGEAAVAQMLRWFARQESRWGRIEAGRDVLSDGFAQWFAARIQGPEADHGRLTAVRTKARQFAERDRAYPTLALEKLLALSTNHEIARYAQVEWELPLVLGLDLFRDQAWALVRMLQQEEYRESFLAYMTAWLRRENQHGMNVPVFERAFGLRRDDGDWAALDAAWQRYMAHEIVGPQAGMQSPADEPAPLRPLLVQIGESGRLGRPGPTTVLLRDPEIGRPTRTGETLAEVVLEPLGPDASSAERMQRLDTLVRALDLPHKRPVQIRFTPSKLGPPSLEDTLLVVQALWLAGYEAIAFDGTAPPGVEALLTILNEVRARRAR